MQHMKGCWSGGRQGCAQGICHGVLQVQQLWGSTGSSPIPGAGKPPRQENGCARSDGSAQALQLEIPKPTASPKPRNPGRSHTWCWNRDMARSFALVKVKEHRHSEERACASLASPEKPLGVLGVCSPFPGICGAFCCLVSLPEHVPALQNRRRLLCSQVSSWVRVKVVIV